MLELWGTQSTPSLPSLPGPLYPGVVAPNKGPIYWSNRTKLCTNAKPNCLNRTVLTFNVFKQKTILIKKKVKLATVVVGDQKAPFPIATTPRCREGHYSFPWIAPLYLTLYCWVLSKAVSNTIFKVFGTTRPGIETKPNKPKSANDTSNKWI